MNRNGYEAQGREFEAVSTVAELSYLHKMSGPIRTETQIGIAELRKRLGVAGAGLRIVEQRELDCSLWQV